MSSLFRNDLSFREIHLRDAAEELEQVYNLQCNVYTQLCPKRMIMIISRNVTSETFRFSRK